MDVVRTIDNQDFAFWSWRGLVQAKFSSSAQIEGKPAQEIRIHAEDKTHRTVILGRRIAVEKDDDVSLLYACPRGSARGALVGIVNHTSGRWLAMPQGHTPLRLRSSWIMEWVRRVERFSLFGAVTLLSSVAALWLHFFGDIRFSLLTWILIGVVAVAILWSLTVLADWREESGIRKILSETEVVLYDLAYRESLSKDEAADGEAVSGGSHFLKGNLLISGPERSPDGGFDDGRPREAPMALPQGGGGPANSMQRSSSS